MIRCESVVAPRLDLSRLRLATEGPAPVPAVPILIHADADIAPDVAPRPDGGVSFFRPYRWGLIITFHSLDVYSGY